MAQFLRIDEVGGEIVPAQIGQDRDQVPMLRREKVRQDANADAGFDGAQNAVCAVDLEDRAPRLVVGAHFQMPVDIGHRYPGAGPTAKRDQAMAIQIRGRLRQAVGLNVTHRGVGVGVDEHQPPLHQVRLAGWRQQDGAVGFPLAAGTVGVVCLRT